MSEITLQGSKINTISQLPKVGDQAPDFVLTKTDLSDLTLADLKGSKVILNIFPSVDTGVCAATVRKFNEHAASVKDTKILCVSLDLPFAHQRFCGAEGIEGVVSVSE
mgnify:FL=1